MREALGSGPDERGLVLPRRVLLERRRVGGLDLVEAVAARVEDELEIRVRRLGVLAIGAVVGALGLNRLREELRLLFGEEIELAVDEVGEAAAAESQKSSR